jgi:integrase
VGAEHHRRRSLKPALHDLRHTGNTLAAGTGATLRELMTRMGHASSRAALIYQHATAERDRAIADALSELAVRGWRPEHGVDHADPSGPAPADR